MNDSNKMSYVRKKLRVILFGYNDQGADALRFLLGKREDVVAVVTHRDDSRENRYFESVAQTAEDAGIRAFMPMNPNAPAFIEKIRGLDPDVILSVYFRRILSPAMLGIARIGAFNVHGSLLPAFRGRAPLNWALIEGAQYTGATFHIMDEKVDSGNIIEQVTLRITEDDDASTMLPRMRAACLDVLAAGWEKVRNGELDGLPQDEHRATLFPRRRPVDGIIDWSKPAVTVRNLVRGVTKPFPGAFTWIDGLEMIIWKAVASSGKPVGITLPSENLKPGTILDDGWIVAGDGYLLPVSVRFDEMEYESELLRILLNGLKGKVCMNVPPSGWKGG